MTSYAHSPIQTPSPVALAEARRRLEALISVRAEKDFLWPRDVPRPSTLHVIHVGDAADQQGLREVLAALAEPGWSEGGRALDMEAQL